MERTTLKLQDACVLSTNDDGIEAPGIACMERALAPLCAKYVVSAPAEDQSGKGAAISTRGPFSYSRHSEPGAAIERVAVEGTPADSALVGIQHILSDSKPDLVVSGVNAGVNLGDDVFSSGTVCAAGKAAMSDIPAIAVSAAYTREQSGIIPPNWETVEALLPGLVADLCGFGWPQNTFYNINFPNLPTSEVRGIRVTQQGRLIGGVSFHVFAERESQDKVSLKRGDTFGTQSKDDDYAAVEDGFIAVTPLLVKIDNPRFIEPLSRVLAREF